MGGSSFQGAGVGAGIGIGCGFGVGWGFGGGPVGFAGLGAGGGCGIGIGMGWGYGLAFGAHYIDTAPVFEETKKRKLNPLQQLQRSLQRLVAGPQRAAQKQSS
ncbi:hypothetical protein WJX73_000278 [Symbiochloris irregularis]|uniref:Uncharacterized protein n=1 Tax=Symbiochloris irregularis TaxID=706552 RepID=A0AAW1PBR0_9CHLO